MGLCDGSGLLAFVVPPAAGQQMAAPPMSSGQQDLLHWSPEDPGQADLRRLILKQLLVLLPPHSLPDRVVLVPALCLTPHGENPETTH